jgi:hypothetical protein
MTRLDNYQRLGAVCSSSRVRLDRHRLLGSRIARESKLATLIYVVLCVATILCFVGTVLRSANGSVTDRAKQARLQSWHDRTADGLELVRFGLAILPRVRQLPGETTPFPANYAG